MSAVTQVVAGLHLFDDFSARPQQLEKWAELCRSGAVAIGFLCLTSSLAVAILALLERM
jgi:hypothetical protein